MKTWYCILRGAPCFPSARPGRSPAARQKALGAKSPSDSARHRELVNRRVPLELPVPGIAPPPDFTMLGGTGMRGPGAAAGLARQRLTASLRSSRPVCLPSHCDSEPETDMDFHIYSSPLGPRSPRNFRPALVEVPRHCQATCPGNPHLPRPAWFPLVSILPPRLLLHLPRRRQQRRRRATMPQAQLRRQRRPTSQTFRPLILRNSPRRSAILRTWGWTTAGVRLPWSNGSLNISTSGPVCHGGPVSSGLVSLSAWPSWNPWWGLQTRRPRSKIWNTSRILFGSRWCITRGHRTLSNSWKLGQSCRLSTTSTVSSHGRASSQWLRSPWVMDASELSEAWLRCRFPGLLRRVLPGWKTWPFPIHTSSSLLRRQDSCT